MKKVVFLFLIFVFFSLPTIVQAQKISFEPTLKQALDNAYDIKIASLDVKISEKVIWEARSMLWPELSVQTNAAYMEDVREEKTYDSSIDNSILWDSNKYQDTSILSLTYTVFDFGINNHKIYTAEIDKKEKETIYNKTVRTVKIDVATIYAKALSLYKELSIKKKLLQLHAELCDNYKRLNKAGKKGQLDVIAEHTKLTMIQQTINNLELNLSKALQELTVYTREKYDPTTAEITSYKDYIAQELLPPTADPKSQNISYNIEDTPELKAALIEIEKKKQEQDISKKSNWPIISFSTKYYGFGEDEDNLSDAFSRVVKKNVVYSLYATMPLFDGFKNWSEQDRLKLELEKLKRTKEKTAAEISLQQEQLTSEANMTFQQLEQSEETTVILNKSLEMVRRLRENDLTDQNRCIEQEMTLLEQINELDQFQISLLLVQYKISVWKKMKG